MTYVEKLQQYIGENGIVDIKWDLYDEFCNRTDLSVEQKVERLAEISYKLLTGEYPSTKMDTSDF